MSRGSPLRRGALAKLAHMPDTYRANGRTVEVLRFERDANEVAVRYPGSRGRFYVNPDNLVMQRPPER